MKSIAATLVVLLGCQYEPPHKPPIVHDTNQKPVADAGIGATFLAGTTIALDGTASSDPDGSIAYYTWSVWTRPSDSVAQLTNATTATPEFVLDAVGDFTFSLDVVDDSFAHATSTVTFTAREPALTVTAGADQAVQYTEQVSLTGTLDAEIDATVQWQIISKPAGSTATLSGATTLTPTFTADLEGDYIIRLTGMTPYNFTVDDVKVTAVVPRQVLSYLVVDAEYSTTLDRYVIVSDVPAKLHLHDPATGTEDAIDLPESPVAVSVAPDGLHAAVGYPGKVAIVDLQTMTITRTSAVPVSIYDLVFDAGNRVHVFAKSINSELVYSVNASSGAVTESMNTASSYADARLQPGGQAVYIGDTRTSPSDIYRYDINGATLDYTRDSPYHGQYEMSGGMWFTEDGTKVVTRAGTVFRASTNSALDMTYLGTLGSCDYGWVAHSATAARFAGVCSEYDAWFQPYRFFLRTFDEQYTQLRSILLPDTPYSGTTYKSVGRFVAFNAAANKLYVIARAGATPGVVHALYTFDP